MLFISYISVYFKVAVYLVLGCFHWANPSEYIPHEVSDESKIKRLVLKLTRKIFTFIGIYNNHILE